MMSKPSPPGYDLRAARCNPLVSLGIWILTLVPCARAEWELDWNLIQQTGAAALREVQDGFDGRHLRALIHETEIDWALTGQYFDAALQGVDWERLAILHPYAQQLLGVLETQPDSAPAADWLRQRIEYMAMAESYVQESRKPVPREVPPVADPPSRPAPSVRPLVPPPVVHRSDWDADTAAWLRRVPEQPSAFARQIVPDLKRVFQGEGIPPVLVWLAEVESSFNPQAKSPAGAVGLFQFMPATAGRFGLALEPEDQRVDALLSARAAAQYLRILHRRFGDWQLALAAYNAGEGRVGRTLRQTGGTNFAGIADRLPLETRMYVPRIAALVDKREQVDIRGLPAPL